MHDAYQHDGNPIQHCQQHDGNFIQHCQPRTASEPNPTIQPVTPEDDITDAIHAKTVNSKLQLVI
jgi:hypothetical protein